MFRFLAFSRDANFSHVIEFLFLFLGFPTYSILLLRISCALPLPHYDYDYCYYHISRNCYWSHFTSFLKITPNYASYTCHYFTLLLLSFARLHKKCIPLLIWNLLWPNGPQILCLLSWNIPCAIFPPQFPLLYRRDLWVRMVFKNIKLDENRSEFYSQHAISSSSPSREVENESQE